MTICRFTIKVYSDNTFSTEKGEYITMINPSNINITNDIEYNNSQLGYNTNWQLRYQSYTPRILSFALLFDSTGILTQNNVDIKKQIEDLEGLIYSYKKDIKEPYYVRVIWGAIDFKGRLLKMQTTYSLFKSEGAPIRAQVNISIIEQKNKISDGNSQKITEKEKKKDEYDNSGGGSDDTETVNKTAKNKAKNDSGDQGVAKNSDDGINGEDNIQKEKKNGDNDGEEEEAGKESSDDNEQNDDNDNGESEKKHDEDNDDVNDDKDSKDDNDEEETDNEVQQVTAQESDSLPSITKKCLENSGVKISSGALNSILSQAAKFNLLDTLKSLAVGALFSLPLTLLGLLKSLMNKVLSLLKRGVTFIKKKVQSGAQSVAGAAKNVYGKAKTGYNNAKEKIT